MTGLLIGLAAPRPRRPGGVGPHPAGGPERGRPGDPLAIANASLQATAQATQTTLDWGKQFLGGLGINLGGNTGGHNTSPSRIPRANGRQAIEYMIQRAGSQMGVPYSWGGGTLDGPSKGVATAPISTGSTARG